MNAPRNRGTERQRAIVGAYRALFNSAMGEVVLRDMMRAAGFARTTYVPGSFDATAHNEGHRAFVLRTAKMANISEDQLLQMMMTPDNTDFGGS